MPKQARSPFLDSWLRSRARYQRHASQPQQACHPSCSQTEACEAVPEERSDVPVDEVNAPSGYEWDLARYVRCPW